MAEDILGKVRSSTVGGRQFTIASASVMKVARDSSSNCEPWLPKRAVRRRAQFEFDVPKLLPYDLSGENSSCTPPNRNFVLAAVSSVSRDPSRRGPAEVRFVHQQNWFPGLNEFDGLDHDDRLSDGRHS